MAFSFAAPIPVVDGIPSIPGLPVLGNLLDFRYNRLELCAAAAQLGPLVRLSLAGLPVYLVSCADIAHQMLVDNAESFEKSAGFQFLRPLIGNGLLSSEGAIHKHHRKLLAPAFAPRRMAGYAEIMTHEARAMISRWRPGERIDVADEMIKVTLAIAGRTLFGLDVRRDTSAVARGVEHAMHAMIDNVSSLIRLGSRWPLPRNLRMSRAVKLLDEVAYRLIAEGRRRGTDRGDVLSMLLLAREDESGAGLSDLEVRDEVITLLIAAHETTASTLTWTFHALGRNPEVLARLDAEVRSVVGTRPVTVEDLAELPYTAAVVEESLRLDPAVYLVPRAVRREVELGGHRFPERSTILIDIRQIHRRPNYYRDPLAFRPERMLAAAKKQRPRHHYLPFGAGPRVCIGSHFAMVEAQIVLATVVQLARLRMVRSEVTPVPLVTLRPRGGLPAVVEHA